MTGIDESSSCRALSLSLSTGIWLGILMGRGVADDDDDDDDRSMISMVVDEIFRPPSNNNMLNSNCKTVNYLLCNIPVCPYDRRPAMYRLYSRTYLPIL